MIESIGRTNKKGDRDVDTLIQLKDEKEICVHKLTIEENLLQERIEELEKRHKDLEECLNEKQLLHKEDNIIVKKVSDIEKQIKEYEQLEKRIKQDKISLQGELAGLFVLSFTKKKEIKSKIEKNNLRIIELKNRIKDLYAEKEEQEKARKSKDIEDLESRINSIKYTINKIDLERRMIEKSISQIKNSINEIDIKINDYDKSRKIEKERKESTNENSENELLYYKIVDINAIGYEYPKLGFVLLKGSKVRLKESHSCNKETRKKRKERAHLIDKNGVLKVEVVLPSIQEATNFCAYGTESAILSWKNKDGITLKEINENRQKKIEAEKNERIQLEVAERLRQEEEAREAERLRKEEEAREAERLRKEEEAREAERLRQEEKAREAERLRQEEEAREAERLRQEEEAKEAERLRQEEEAKEAERLRQEEEAREAERIRQEEVREAERIHQEKDTKEEVNGVSFAYIYNLNPFDYTDISIKSLDFSTRLSNILNKIGIKNVEELLQLNDEELYHIKGFGKNSSNELHSYLNGLHNSSFLTQKSVKTEQLSNDNYMVFSDETTVSYSDRYKLNPFDYSDISIESLDFSTRLLTVLQKKGVNNVEDLLKTNDSELYRIRGFGKECFSEVHRFLVSLSLVQDYILHKYPKSAEINEVLNSYKRRILNGDFSFIDENRISWKTRIFINRYKEAYELLGKDFIFNAVEPDSKINSIVEMLRVFTDSVKGRKQLESILMDIPSSRLAIKISLVIKCYTDDNNSQEYLANYIHEDGQSLKEYLFSNTDKIANSDKHFTRLVDWCQYNLDKDIEDFFVGQMKNEREFQIISYRSERRTLDEIGKIFSLTRERVRQIEQKVKRRFSIWQKRRRIAFKVFLDLGEESGVSSAEIIGCFKEYGKEFVYLLKACDTDDVIYDKQLDMFVMDDRSLTGRIQSYIESLPDVFSEKKLPGIIKVATEEYEYPEKMVLAVIEDTYKKTGDTYHRFRLTLASVYGDILKKYYPEGIHIYDPSEIGNFRKYVLSDYDIDLSDRSDHAIGAVISRISILCGRGIYKLRQDKQYIPKKLAQRIHEYVEHSPMPVFMINTLFSVFEEDLLLAGIDNKYFLQGILRDLFDSEWIIRRDYISKDESYTSITSSIVGYIRNSLYPVSKVDISEKFPGVTEIVINLSVTDPNIINLYGSYIHSSHLKLSKTDKQYLKITIDKFLREKGFCHCKEIYEYINADYPVLLSNNYVQFAFGLYSLLEYLFRDEYNFSRPYIAKENAVIERANDMLEGIVKESDRIDISEILAFARDHHIVIYSIREFIDSFNDTHLLINDLEMASIKYIGISEEVAIDIEERIISEIDSTVPIHQLKCISNLPNINIEWNAWLIYSILKKWSTKLEVGASANQFRQSYPIVAPIGKIDLTSIDESAGDHEGKIIMADDLSNIDDLIGEFVIEEMEDIDGL